MVILAKMDGQFNGPETMNNKPLMPARQTKSLVASVRHIVRAGCSRQKASMHLSRACKGLFPPAVQRMVDKADAWADPSRIPPGCIDWQDGAQKKHGIVTHLNGHTTNCKMSVRRPGHVDIECSKANFLSKFKKALQVDEVYSQCHRSASQRDSLRHWHPLTATQQQWATDSADMASWVQHRHRRHVSSHPKPARRPLGDGHSRLDGWAI